MYIVIYRTFSFWNIILKFLGIRHQLHNLEGYIQVPKSNKEMLVMAFLYFLITSLAQNVVSLRFTIRPSLFRDVIKIIHMKEHQLTTQNKQAGIMRIRQCIYLLRYTFQAALGSLVFRHSCKRNHWKDSISISSEWSSKSHY